MKLDFSRQIVEKYSNIKFHENPSFGSRVVPYWRTDGETEKPTDVTKIIVAFHNSANTPKNQVINLLDITQVNHQISKFSWL
jgi:hypothetical protein